MCVAQDVRLAASLAGTVAVSLSIGVSLARNEIRNEVEAWIEDATNVEARNGGIVFDAGVTDDPDAFTSDYSTSSGTVALKKGDTVRDGDQVYRFLGEGEKIQPNTNRRRARST